MRRKQLLSRLPLKKKVLMLMFGLAMAGAVIVAASIILQKSPTPAETRAGHSSSRRPSTTAKRAAAPSPSMKASSAAVSKPSVVRPAPAAPPPIVPASLLNLANWKLTLPIDTAHAGNPDEITQPELAAFGSNPYFRVSGSGVAFQAPVGGATTSGSGYPRSELREMTASGRQEASWSNTSGNHTMTLREAITHLPIAKPAVVAAQIHDASDDVIMIYLQGSTLYVEAGSKNIGTLDAGYVLGAPFTVQITATGGHIYVSYNGTQKVDYDHSGGGYYFKAGCYTQSNPSKGDSPAAYGEVVIYGLQVSHT